MMHRLLTVNSVPGSLTRHVATVKRSTPCTNIVQFRFYLKMRFDVPLSTKYFGHVPPRLANVFNNVMYVPPINGSEILVWNAEMPTNWIVLVK